MVERDKNHPSVIIWSLGQRSGRRRQLRERLRAGSSSAIRRGRSSTSGPSSGRTRTSTARCIRRSRTSSQVRRRRSPTRPLIHVRVRPRHGQFDRQPPGLLGRHRDPTPLQGGFIWDWVDQGLRPRRTPRAGSFWAFGGDYGPADVPARPELLLQRPRRARTGRPIPASSRSRRSISSSSSRRPDPPRARSRSSTATTSSALTGSISAGSSRPTARPWLRARSSKAGRSASRRARSCGSPSPASRQSRVTEYFLNVSLRSREASPGIPKGHTLSPRNSSALPCRAATSGSAPQPAPAPIAVEDGPRFVHRHRRDFPSRSTGSRESWILSSWAGMSSSPPGSSRTSGARRRTTISGTRCPGVWPSGGRPAFIAT